MALDFGGGAVERHVAAAAGTGPAVYDFLIEEGVRDSNPVGRGAYTPGRRFGGGGSRTLVPRMVKLPWIPGEAKGCNCWWSSVPSRSAIG